jgi:hypothetical protein
MRRFLMTIALTCVLSGSALAGEMPTCGLASEEPTMDQPVQPGHVPTSDSTSPGDIHSIDVSILLTVLDLVF